MRAPWQPVDAGPMFRRVTRRKDWVTHVVQGPVPAMIKVDSSGRLVSDDDAFILVTTCGLRVKMNTGGRNRFTAQPATCLTCVAGGHRR